MSSRALLTVGGLAAAAAAVFLWTRLGLSYLHGQLVGLVWLDYVDGVPLERRTATAFRAMQAAARAAGVDLVLNSGFRTWWEQTALYQQYVERERSAVVAEPGHSNHQQGIAVDIAVRSSTSSPEYLWLAANAASYGFRRTVSSEPWHWEYSA